MELISVIIPIYNSDKYLSRCILSIQEQLYENLEIILVDDGSTDDSLKICQEYAEKDLRIKVIHKENGGLSSARNKGLECSSGEYIFFVDSDDYIATETLQILLNEIKLNYADVAMCEYIKVDENGGLLELPALKEENIIIVNGERLLLENAYGKEKTFVVVWNKLYKRKIFEKIRFCEGKTHEDEFIFHKICMQCETIVRVNKIFYYYTQRKESIMGIGVSEKSIDALEAYLSRILYMKKNENSEMQKACDYTIAVFFHLAIRYSLSLGFDNYELNSRVRKLRREILEFFPRLMKCSLKMKEKFSFGVWLLSPKIYGKIWKKRKAV